MLTAQRRKQDPLNRINPRSLTASPVNEYLQNCHASVHCPRKGNPFVTDAERQTIIPFLVGAPLSVSHAIKRVTDQQDAPPQIPSNPQIHLLLPHIYHTLLLSYHHQLHLQQP